jgi:ribosomal protein S12 methylthiotransferase
VEGAAANALPGAVPEEVKAERWHRLMAAQREVSRKLNAGRVGRTIDVIVDKVDGKGAAGRSTWDAPEIDGAVLLEGASGAKPGDIVRARVTNADEYDVWAELSCQAG